MCEHNCGIDHSLEEIPENSLFNQINLEDSECFNESEENPLKYCIKPYNERHNSKFLESDIDPELIFSKPAIHFKKVVFPEPLSPRNEMISPFLIEKERSLIIG